ncbi:type II toxin-antitoxin system YafQ family toxin [Acetobacterium wieringae]|uniref:mRNA interferase YafQ n=1 Tax=Acetobacterium wieringae TaxID=52694 RepID=A0A1F2PDA0_9FIRM|nr:mRNA interferase YafQ [Acetobacterium wieringae]
MKYEVKFTNQFKKDLKLAKKQGKDIERLYAVIEKLADEEPLEQKYRDHDLSGNFKGCHECWFSVNSLSCRQSFNLVLRKL